MTVVSWVLLEAEMMAEEMDCSAAVKLVAKKPACWDATMVS